MADLAERFASNPLLTPSDVTASRPDLNVICVLNPGACTYAGKTWLILGVAEGIPATESMVNAIILDPAVSGGVRLLKPGRTTRHSNSPTHAAFGTTARCTSRRSPICAWPRAATANISRSSRSPRSKDRGR